MGKIIITADDYGACDFIDNGIIRALRGGHINTVSAFVTHSDSVQRLKSLLQLREELFAEKQFQFNIGLHFSLTSGFSLQHKKSTLTEAAPREDGNYYFLSEKKYPFKYVSDNDMKNELIAQLQSLESTLGDVHIDHVSVHCGIPYLDARLFPVYVDTIRSYVPKTPTPSGTLPVRSPGSWFRGKGIPNCCYHPENGGIILIPGLAAQGIGFGYWKKIKQTTGKKLIAKKEDVVKAGLRTPDYLVDVIYNQACAPGINCVVNAIKGADISAELMLHLGYQDGLDDLEELEFEQAVNTVHGIDKIYFEKRMREELATIEEINLAQATTAHPDIQRIFYSDL